MMPKALLSFNSPVERMVEYAEEIELYGKVEMRRGVSGDAAELQRLTRAAYAKWVRVIGREPKPMGADYEEAVKSHRFDLIYVEGRLAGLIETINQGNSLLVENVAVDPDFQGRGLSRPAMIGQR
jgi:hypothetical protein